VGADEKADRTRYALRHTNGATESSLARDLAQLNERDARDMHVAPEAADANWLAGPLPD
jgi:hypothetical protein